MKIDLQIRDIILGVVIIALGFWMALSLQNIKKEVVSLQQQVNFTQRLAGVENTLGQVVNFLNKPQQQGK